MKAKGLFITGTDTGVGKTVVTLALMRGLQQKGLRVLGMKPVATGAVWRDGRLVNEDALALWRAGSVAVAYQQINPYLFESPVSPHLAARTAGKRIDIGNIECHCADLQQTADCVLVEGVGGWLVPLNERDKLADLALALDLPVVLVVGLRLGCLNHALLSLASIRASGAELAGWIGNRIDPDFRHAAENLETLHIEFGTPPLAVLPFHGQPDAISEANFPALCPDRILRLLYA